MRAVAKLTKSVREKDSLLCVGLDFPVGGDSNSQRDQAIQAIHRTHEYAACFKANLAFYLNDPFVVFSMVEMAKHYNVPFILDAKFGDIENTAKHQAEFAFETIGADAVTVNPYMGSDAVMPFAEYDDKMVFVLTHTSNKSEFTLQDWKVGEDQFFTVGTKAAGLAHFVGEKNGNVGAVVGATDLRKLSVVRYYYRDMWILAPGVGAQGGTLEGTVRHGLSWSNYNWPSSPKLLVNVGRGIFKGTPEGWSANTKAIRDECRRVRGVVPE